MTNKEGWCISVSAIQWSQPWFLGACTVDKFRNFCHWNNQQPSLLQTPSERFFCTPFPPRRSCDCSSLGPDPCFPTTLPMPLALELYLYHECPAHVLDIEWGSICPGLQSTVAPCTSILYASGPVFMTGPQVPVPWTLEPLTVVICTWPCPRFWLPTCSTWPHTSLSTLQCVHKYRHSRTQLCGHYIGSTYQKWNNFYCEHTHKQELVPRGSSITMLFPVE